MRLARGNTCGICTKGSYPIPAQWYHNINKNKLINDNNNINSTILIKYLSMNGKKLALLVAVVAVSAFLLAQHQ